MRRAWFLGAYHKTGCLLVIKLLDLLSGGYVRLEGAFQPPLPSLDAQPFAHYWFAPNASALAALPADVDWRLAHFARDPAELVASAFRGPRRYHAVATAGERWLDMRADRRRAPPRDARELRAVRAVPQRLRDAGEMGLAHGVTFFLKRGEGWRAVLKAFGDAGAVLEAYRARGDIELMVANAEALSGEGRALTAALTVLLGDFQRDFSGTLECLLRFLAPARPGFDVSAALEQARALDPALPPRTAADALHVTRGKHNNTEVLASVRRLPFIRDAAAALDAAARRSAARCRPR